MYKLIAIKGPHSSDASPPYKMPPVLDTLLPGASLNTHAPTNPHFPIEREVILARGEKSPKVLGPEPRGGRRGRLGAVAPDTPPKALPAWPPNLNQQAGTSGEVYRQPEHNYRYAIDYTQNQGAIPRNHIIENHSAKSQILAKNYYPVPEKVNGSQQITVTVETAKDVTKDAPKSSKTVSKTYHTLKDIISSKFKTKENNDFDKNNQEQSLNNSEENKRPEKEQFVSPDNRNKENILSSRPVVQSRPDTQYSHLNPNPYASPGTNRQILQQQMLHHQLLMNQQTRSQEMLAAISHNRPQALGADALYQHYQMSDRRNTMYQKEIDVRSMANFTSLKTSSQNQADNSYSRSDLRSPQQLEREIVRQRGFVDNRRSASHPHLLEDFYHKSDIAIPQSYDRSRRNSHCNLLNETPNDAQHRSYSQDERESDDGGFRSRFSYQNRTNFDNHSRNSGRSLQSNREGSKNGDLHKSVRGTPNIAEANDVSGIVSQVERTDENSSQKSVDSVYDSSKKIDACVKLSPFRQTPNRLEDLKTREKKSAGSGTSSDYDKSGGPSSNVDSGRGSVAYSSGRLLPSHPAHSEPPTSEKCIEDIPPTSNQTDVPGHSGENEWADLVECELRQILEPKLCAMRLSSGSSDGSLTPPLPPLSPASDVHKRNSLPGRSCDYPEERRRGRESPRWHAHKKHSSKREQHYKKHLFGLDTTDITSTTTRSLDLSSLLDARTDSDASGLGGGGGVSGAGDARAIRRQLRGLENMYGEVLQLLGVRKPNGLSKPALDARLSSKRKYGSMSSLPSSSVSSRPARDHRRLPHDHRRKHDIKGINKRFQRLESHVVTLARSVAHLSSELRTHHLLVREVDAVRAELQALRHMYRSQQCMRGGPTQPSDPHCFSNPDRVKRLTKFFGDEPPLMRLFLKRLGYEKYASLLEKEKVGAMELPYIGEDKLRALGVPLGPRMRILKEAGIHQDLRPISRDDPHTTTTTLAIV